MSQHVIEQGEEAAMDLMPVRKMDAGASLRRFWSWDFCVHHPPEAAAPPPRMRSATIDTHISGASQDVTMEKDGLEQMLQHAKTAWDNLFPPKLDADENFSSSKTQKDPTNMTITSREITFNSAQQQQQQEEEKQVTLSVIVTEPGTSRAMRVYRGLELFLLAIFVLGMTLRLLNQSGVKFNFILEPNDRQS